MAALGTSMVDQGRASGVWLSLPFSLFAHCCELHASGDKNAREHVLPTTPDSKAFKKCMYACVCVCARALAKPIDRYVVLQLYYVILSLRPVPQVKKPRKMSFLPLREAVRPSKVAGLILPSDFGKLVGAARQ